MFGEIDGARAADARLRHRRRSRRTPRCANWSRLSLIDESNDGKTITFPQIHLRDAVYNAMPERRRIELARSPAPGALIGETALFTDAKRTTTRLSRASRRRWSDPPPAFPEDARRLSGRGAAHARCHRLKQPPRTNFRACAIAWCAGRCAGEPARCARGGVAPPRAEHSAARNSALSWITRSTALSENRALPESAAWRSLVAYVRYTFTDYDELRTQGYDRDSARHFVADEMAEGAVTLGGAPAVGSRGLIPRDRHTRRVQSRYE